MRENVYTTDLGGISMHITPQSASWLRSISKWTKFLSVLGLIMIVLMAIGILGMNTVFRSMNFYQMPNGDVYQAFFSGSAPWIISIIYIIMLIIYAIPLFFLFKFSTRMQDALDAGDTVRLSDAMHYLQKYYLYIGVLTAIYLAIFVIAIIIAAVGI